MLHLLVAPIHNLSPTKIVEMVAEKGGWHGSGQAPREMSVALENALATLDMGEEIRGNLGV